MHYLTDVLKKYAVFSGRAARKEYWMFVLSCLIIYFVLQLCSFVTRGSAPQSLFALVYWVFALATLVPSIAVGIRRLHDTDRSGWWLLISLIPLIGGIVLLVFMASDSTPGANRYGANPKEVPVSATPPQFV